MAPASYDVAVVGLGPNGLRVLTCLAAQGLRIIGFEQGRLGQTIRDWHVGAEAVGAHPELVVDASAAWRGGVGWAKDSRGRSERRALVKHCGRYMEWNDVAFCKRADFLAYMAYVCRKHDLARRGIAELRRVTSVVRDDAAGVYKLTSHHRHAPLVSAETRATYVVLATGAMSVPRRLAVPGGHLKHVLSQSDVQHTRDIEGKAAVVVGMRESALQVSIAMVARRVRSLLLCSRGSRAVLEPSIGSITDWSMQRYRLSNDDWRSERVWYRLFYLGLHRILGRWRRSGVVQLRTGCQVRSINASHVVLRLQSSGGDGKSDLAEETVPADMVVAAIGANTSYRPALLSGLGILSPTVNATTGETSLPNLFTLGFDLPGQADHYGQGIYENWLTWGGAAAQSTCKEIGKRSSACVREGAGTCPLEL